MRRLLITLPVSNLPIQSQVRSAAPGTLINVSDSEYQVLEDGPLRNSYQVVELWPDS